MQSIWPWRFELIQGQYLTNISHKLELETCSFLGFFVIPWWNTYSFLREDWAKIVLPLLSIIICHLQLAAGVLSPHRLLFYFKHTQRISFCYSWDPLLIQPILSFCFPDIFSAIFWLCVCSISWWSSSSLFIFPLNAILGLITCLGWCGMKTPHLLFLRACSHKTVPSCFWEAEVGPRCAGTLFSVHCQHNTSPHPPQAFKVIWRRNPQKSVIFCAPIVWCRLPPPIHPVGSGPPWLFWCS